MPVTANDEHLAALALFRSGDQRMTMVIVEDIDVWMPLVSAARSYIMEEAQGRHPDKLVINPAKIDIDIERQRARAKVVVLATTDARDD